MSGEILFSASSASRAEKCTGSGLFNAMRVSSPEGAFGSAGHESLYHRAIYGVDEAMRMLPDTCARFGLTEQQTGMLAARLRKFAWSPPPAAVGELSLAICGTLGDVRVVRSKGGKGHYEDLPDDALTAGQLDVMWAEPFPLTRNADGRIVCPVKSTLIVTDYKFGESDHYVDPVERNLQLAINTTAAALWTGAERAVAVVLWVRDEHGEWDAGPVMTSRDFSATLERVVALRDKRIAERDRIASGALPTTHEGAWCAYCPSESSCPSKLMAVRAALANNTGALIPAIAEVLTNDEARRLPIYASTLERWAKKLKDAAQAHVRRNGPITYEDGTQYGKVVVERERIDPVAAMTVLHEELGPHVGEAIDVSKAAIERAFDSLHADLGLTRQTSAAMRRTLAKLHERKAITKVSREEMRMHRPSDATPKEVAGATPAATSTEGAFESRQARGVQAQPKAVTRRNGLPEESPFFSDADDGPL